MYARSLNVIYLPWRIFKANLPRPCYLAFIQLNETDKKKLKHCFPLSFLSSKKKVCQVFPGRSDLKSRQRLTQIIKRKVMTREEGAERGFIVDDLCYLSLETGFAQ
ncbi:hypothetical protein AVEN_67087-1 [Araneus ventricosus]|uniref:Uncharacterized protein n=1 Tax=Araneus ventricosus TaxID=182803 RepID=A0A4Y2FT78_ARAVE|nr:hypothetical protein AVEN_67087-1 [Araneus ventricosus]